MAFDADFLHKYQAAPSREVFNFLNERGNSCDMSDTGIGKSYITAGALKNLKQPFVIICPKAVVNAWLNVCFETNIRPFLIINYEKLNRGNSPYGTWVSIKDKHGVSHKNFKWNIPKNCVLVFDEAHKCKGRKSSNSKMLIAAKLDNYRIHLMSASLATNPTEMYATGFVLGLHNIKNFRNWCMKYGCYTDSFGGLHFDSENKKSKKIMLRIHDYIFNNKNTKRGIRVRIKDIGEEFPESLIISEAYDMGANTNKINHVYDEMNRELDKLDEFSKNYSEHVFAIIMKARRKSELLKVPFFVDTMMDIYEEGKSIVLFVNFTQTVEAVQNRLENAGFTNICKIVGGQNAKVRQENIDKFQRNECRIMICNIQAGNVGIGLHDLSGEHERVSLISPNYSAIQMLQTLGRVWRNGGSKSVQKIVFASQTIEETACIRVREKLQNLSALNDGDLTSGINI